MSVALGAIQAFLLVLDKLTDAWEGVGSELEETSNGLSRCRL